MYMSCAALSYDSPRRCGRCVGYTQGQPDVEVAQHAVDYLREVARDRATPFYIMAGFLLVTLTHQLRRDNVQDVLLMDIQESDGGA